MALALFGVLSYYLGARGRVGGAQRPVETIDDTFEAGDECDDALFSLATRGLNLLFPDRERFCVYGSPHRVIR